MKPDEAMEHHDDEPGWYDKDSYSDDDEQGHEDEPGWYDKDSYSEDP